jgi:hypothetical protein
MLAGAAGAVVARRKSHEATQVTQLARPQSAPIGSGAKNGNMREVNINMGQFR